MMVKNRANMDTWVSFRYEGIYIIIDLGIF